MLESDLKEAIRLCNVQREKIEHLQRCLSIALPSGAEEETTGLGEEQEQELSPSVQQHFAEWQKLDGCLQALKQTNDKSLREDFEQFADVKKEAEDNNAEPGSVESSPSKTIAARAEAGGVCVCVCVWSLARALSLSHTHTHTNTHSCGLCSSSWQWAC